MLDADSFQNILAIVRTCVHAGRPELIEQALIDRQHVGEVQAKIANERTVPPAARPAAAANIFGGPTPEEADALTQAVRQRMAAMAGKPRQ